MIRFRCPVVFLITCAIEGQIRRGRRQGLRAGSENEKEAGASEERNPGEE
ncbi:MAG: hypothetical protein IJM25_02560 [Eubacterium sp.]|nr:hypothetical protein [Eubacterium sp.]